MKIWFEGKLMITMKSNNICNFLYGTHIKIAAWFLHGQSLKRLLFQRSQSKNVGKQFTVAIWVSMLIS